MLGLEDNTREYRFKPPHKCIFLLHAELTLGGYRQFTRSINVFYFLGKRVCHHGHIHTVFYTWGELVGLRAVTFWCSQITLLSFKSGNKSSTLGHAHILWLRGGGALMKNTYCCFNTGMSSLSSNLFSSWSTSCCIMLFKYRSCQP